MDKLCPFMSATGTKMFSRACAAEECSLWSEAGEECELITLSRGVWQIALHLGNLRDELKGAR